MHQLSSPFLMAERAASRKKHEHVAKKAGKREQPVLGTLARQLSKLFRLCPKGEQIKRGKRKERARRIIYDMQPVLFEEEQGMADAAVRRCGKRMRLRAFHASREKRPLNRLGRERTEVHVTHARENRRQKRRTLRRHEQEEDRALRLFQGLQEAVRRRLVHRIGVVHKDDEAPRKERSSRDLFLNLTHGFDAQDARALAAALRRRLDAVGMRAREEGAARRADAARRILPAAQQGCGQDARGLPLSHAGKPREEERMGQTAALQHAPQPFDIPFVPENVLPRERFRHHM